MRWKEWKKEEDNKKSVTKKNYLAEKSTPERKKITEKMMKVKKTQKKNLHIHITKQTNQIHRTTNPYTILSH